MTNSGTNVLKEIRELLRSVDAKLDELLGRQASENRGLNREEELPKQSVRSRMRFEIPPAPSESELHRIPIPSRSIDSELQLASHRSFVPGGFVSLPEHLRHTMQVIVTFGEATALNVSEKTGRSRAAESDYLNQLVDRGFLKKTRRGREILFQVFSLHTLCPMCGSRVPLNVKFCNYCGAALFKPEQVFRD